MTVSRREFLHVSAGSGAGTGLGGMLGLGIAPGRARAQELRIKERMSVPSICPFCSVGCATLVHTKGGEIINIEGDPRSPHNEGPLCPKGAAICQLHRNPNRTTRVLHRQPGAREWEVVDLAWAMDRVATLLKQSHDETFIERLPDGKLVNMMPAIFALGGATLDNEFNHVAQKPIHAREHSVHWRGSPRARTQRSINGTRCGTPAAQEVVPFSTGEVFNVHPVLTRVWLPAGRWPGPGVWLWPVLRSRHTADLTV